MSTTFPGRRRAAVPVLTAALLALMLSAAPAVHARLRHAHGVERVGAHDAVAGEVIVRFKAGAPAAARARAESDEDIDESAPVGRGHHVLMHSRSRSTAQLLQRLRARPDVALAVPNHLVRMALVPNEPPMQFASLWGLATVRAPAAWDTSTGGTGAVAAVVDTGIDYSHPDLAANVWSAPRAYTVTIGGVDITCAAGTHGFNAITKACDPLDDNNHGTHVAGIIGAVGNNALGVVGVNWTTRLMGVKFIDAGGMGTLADAMDALEYTLQVRQALGAEANVRVANNSWVVPGGEALADAVLRAAANELLLVFAAGNAYGDNDAAPFYPQSWILPNLLSVAATNEFDGKAYFTNYGATTVQLGAPGTNIISTARNAGYVKYSGTSMAAPYVAGAAMLMLSRDPSQGAATLRQRLMETVTPLTELAGITATGGRLDAASALATALPLPGFTLYTSPGWHLSVPQGAAGAIAVDVAGSNGFSSPVALAVDTTGLDPAISLGTAVLPGAGHAELPVAVGWGVPVGDYTLPVVATAAGQVHGVTVLLSVTPGQQPDFAPWASTTTPTVRRDKSVTLGVGATALGGFTGSTSWSLTGLPREAKARFTSTTLAAGTGTTLKLTADSTTPVGSYPLTVTVSAGALTHTLVLTWTVTK